MKYCTRHNFTDRQLSRTPSSPIRAHFVIPYLHVAPEIVYNEEKELSDAKHKDDTAGLDSTKQAVAEKLRKKSLALSSPAVRTVRSKKLERKQEKRLKLIYAGGTPKHDGSSMRKEDLHQLMGVCKEGFSKCFSDLACDPRYPAFIKSCVITWAHLPHAGKVLCP